MSRFLHSGPAASPFRLLLAHGAGAPMTSPFLDSCAAEICARGIGVTRFEFAYMAKRRDGGRKSPPPKIEKLMVEFSDAINSLGRDLRPDQRLVIGGKSMGGRVASLIADAHWQAGSVAGLVCLGYPFHPPAKPEQLRTNHLHTLRCPALIVQGVRDPFGTRAEVEALTLSASIQLSWIGDGDHDFGPRGASPHTRQGNMVDAAEAVAGFIATLA